MPILVNNQPMDEQWVRNEANGWRDRFRAEMPHLDDLTFGIELHKFARDKVITRMLLHQAAGTESPEDLIAGIVALVPSPKKQEVKLYYQNFPQAFYAPEMIRAAHIVKNVDEKTTEEQAEAAIREIEVKLKDGSEFAVLADAYSDCPGKGGDLGFFARGEMVEEFDQAVFDLKPGETSAVFRSPFGFHIARLLERRSSGLRPFNEVRKQIEDALWEEKRLRAVDDLVNGLRARADIRKI